MLYYTILLDNFTRIVYDLLCSDEDIATQTQDTLLSWACANIFYQVP